MAKTVYIDESGVSGNESITVVAGVIVDADKQWKFVESSFDEIVLKYVPPVYQEDFVFRATDLYYHASKKFDPDVFPVAQRRAALKELAGLPLYWRLPLVFGVQDKHTKKAVASTHPGATHQVSAVHHALTYAYCVIGAERYMREACPSGETARIVVEDSDSARKAINHVHEILRGKGLNRPEHDYLRLTAQNSNVELPLRRIVDAPHLAGKWGAPFLQIADVVAFICRLYFENKSDIELTNALTGNHPEKLRIDPAPNGRIEGYSILWYPPRQA